MAVKWDVREVTADVKELNDVRMEEEREEVGEPADEKTEGEGKEEEDELEDATALDIRAVVEQCSSAIQQRLFNYTTIAMESMHGQVEMVKGASAMVLSLLAVTVTCG